MSKKNIQIFIDGASRGNPGAAGAGIYVLDKDSKKYLFEKFFYLGKKTNNQAEYLALAIAAFYIKKEYPNPTTNIFYFVSDSQLLVRQMTGKYKVKNEVIRNIKTLTEYLLEDKQYRFRHVLREKNKMADALANKGVDTKTALPKGFVTLLKKFFN